MLRLIYHLLQTALIVAIVGIGGLATAKRVQTGSWSLPDRDDIAWVRHIMKRDDAPSRIIYLNRQQLTVRGGFDKADENRTQFIALGAQRTIPGFRGSDRQWRRIVRCVQRKFAAFDVQVTDVRPDTEHYAMVHVGGRPRDLYGHRRGAMGGVAPFNGDVIADAIAFAFSDTLKNRPSSVCRTVAHELGHIYGLDHSYRCRDLMTYKRGCGQKHFVNAQVPCGEVQRRDCDHGHATQNSFALLYRVLGPRRAEPMTTLARASGRPSGPQPH